jgi:protein-disulfide isomerase
MKTGGSDSPYCPIFLFRFRCCWTRCSGILLSPMSHFRVALLLLISAFCAATSVAQSADAPKAKQPIATVDGQSIYDEDLAASVQGQLLPLRNQEYEIKKKALDNLIEQKLLEAAAKKKGLTTDKLLEQELDSKVPDPSDAEMEAYYLGIREKVNRPFADVKTLVRSALRNAKIQQARQDYLKRLRADSNVAILLSVPRIEVSYDPARVRGNPKAPVMIVEFSDYQCPYCHQVEPTLKAVLAKYGDKVSFSYRDFPLTAIHSQAEIAAEASRCALEQGKFWEYHDQLFTASKLDKDSLIEYARNLKLDEKQFSSCLTSEKYKADIDKDLQAGRKAGINGTPGFFINGIEISGAQGQDAFTRVIDDELARKSKHPTASVSVSRVER